MNQILGWQQKPLLRKLFISCVTLSFVLTNTAFAAYKPPAQPSSPKRPTGSNGSRTNGCTGNAQTSLTALAPQSHIGQTVSAQPTFAWFVPDSEPREIEFSLYEDNGGGNTKRIQSVKLRSYSGIMKYSLSQQRLRLSAGKTYFWQVALLCNPNHPSEDLLVKAEIQVIAIQSSLKNALASTKESHKRADLYAESGLWYDALSEIIEAPKAYSLSLLEDLRKVEIEAAKVLDGKKKKRLEEQALQLQQIINIEKQKR